MKLFLKYIKIRRFNAKRKYFIIFVYFIFNFYLMVLIFYGLIRLIFIHACAKCYELPSYISTMFYLKNILKSDYFLGILAKRTKIKHYTTCIYYI